MLDYNHSIGASKPLRTLNLFCQCVDDIVNGAHLMCSNFQIVDGAGIADLGHT